MIKYKEKGSDEIKIAKRGLVVYDDNGEMFKIDLNIFNELEILACDGKISILPSTSNQIFLTQKD